MALFTVETAAEYARRSHLPTSARFKKEEPAKEEQPVTQEIPQPADSTQTIELVRVRKRLDALDALMDAAETDKEWDNYSRSYERIFKAWCWLAGIPNPGSMRPSKATTTRRPTVSPIEPETPPVAT